MFTPPLGVNLFAACLLAITYLPWISPGLVDLLRQAHVPELIRLLQ